MSEVFSFRLDPNNPREAVALEVIRTWQGKGFSIRHIMVEALWKLEREADQPYGEQIDRVNEKLDDLFDLLRSSRENRGEDPVSEEQADRSQDLSSHFLASIKVTAKPGLRME